MKSTQPEAGAPQDKKPPVEKKSKMELRAVLRFELGEQMLEELREINKTLEILTTQKQRELTPDEPPTAEDG